MRLELHSHQIALFHANAMLTGQAAADFHAKLQYIGTKGFSAAKTIGVIRVKHNQRMQIAITGMEHIGDLERVLIAHLANAPQHARQFAGWNGAIHAEVIGADAPDRAKGTFAAFPDGKALFRGLRNLQADRVKPRADILDARQQGILFRDAAFNFNDQHGFRIQRIAGMGKSLTSMDAGLVHEFQRHRNNAAADNGIHRGTRDFNGIEGCQHGARAFGTAQNTHGHFRHNPQLSFTARDQAQPIITRRVQISAANVQHLTFNGHEFHAEQVIRRHAVFQAMRTAGIHHHIAANHAGQLRRRIGRIEKPISLHRLGDADIRDASAHHRIAIRKIDFMNGVEPHETHDNRISQRQRTTGKAGPRTTRHHANALFMAIPQHGGDLFGGGRQHHRERHLPIGGKPIGFIGLQANALSNHAIARNKRAECRDNFFASGKYFGLGCGQSDHCGFL